MGHNSFESRAFGAHGCEGIDCDSKMSLERALVILFVWILSSNQHKESDHGKNAANGGKAGSEGGGMRGGETVIARGHVLTAVFTQRYLPVAPLDSPLS